MCIAAAIAGAAVVGAGASIYSANKASGAQRDAANRSNDAQLAMYDQTRADQAPWRAAGGQAVDALSRWYGLGGVNLNQSGQDNSGQVTTPPVTAGYPLTGYSRHGALINPSGTGQAQGGSLGGVGYAQGGKPTTPEEQAAENAQFAKDPMSLFDRLGGASVAVGSGPNPFAPNGGGAPSPFSPGGGSNSSSNYYNNILSNLPGYQFQLDQGSQAVSRNLAAQGLLQSGAAGKALQQYGQGVASNYATQYVNGLQSLAGLGQTSVQSTGNIGANTANQIGANQIYSGNAQASGYAGTANAINSGLSGVAGAYGMYNTWQNQGYNNGSYASVMNNGNFGGPNAYGSGYTFEDYGATP